MILYEVGQIIPSFINHNEGVLFDIADEGANLIVFFKNPTEDEISQFKKSFEIRFTKLYDVIMLTVKIGNLNWMDAPYTPHKSKYLTKLQLPNKNQGLALTLYLVDAVKGQIKTMRFLGLSEKFTRSLFAEVMEEKMKPFSEANYTNNLNRIFSIYPTKKIVQMSGVYCKFD